MSPEFPDEFEKAWRQAAEDAGAETQLVEAEIEVIRQLLRQSGEFFITFFLAESLDLPVPKFHEEIWGLLTDSAAEKERVLLAIPRDHAKTTLSKLVVLWYWLFTRHRFCVYLSSTAPIAKGACRDIMDFMLNPNFIAVYGKIKLVKSSENEGLWIFDLQVRPGVWKRCILRGLGQGQQMRGINIDNQRPDIAVVDDVEDNDVVDSEAQQKKLDKWMFGTFLKALARKKKVLWLGNMLAKSSLLARLSRRPKWNPVVFGCLVKDSVTGILQPLWPGKWTVHALQEDFQEYKDEGLVETWMCEMMNMPGHGENGFTADNINYVPMLTPDDVDYAWLTLDPAFGQKSHNDESSITVHMVPRGGGTPRSYCWGHSPLWDEFRIFQEMLDAATYWGAWVWGIEAVAAQKVLISLFNVLLAQRMLLNQVEMIPLMSGRGDPKAGRIKAYVALMSNGEWGLIESDVDITQQILDYDFRKKDQADDIIDSAAYGPMMLDAYLPVIQAAAMGVNLENNGRVQHEMEVAGV